MIETIYLAKDFNFDDYDYSQLDILCKYRVPLLTDYPKLVIFLYTNTIFNEWINKKSNNITEHSIIHKLISIVKILTLNNRNEIIHSQIDINDDHIWEKIIDSFADNIPSKDSFRKHLSKKKKKYN